MVYSILKKFINEIKRIAVKHQNSSDESCIKSHIDALVKSYSNKINGNLYIEKEEWSKIFIELGKCCNITSSPEWMTVMKIARKKVNAKKHSAIYRRKRRR